MKTIKEWFETLPEPIRSQALANMNKAHKSKQRPDLSGSILSAFHWDETKEGWDYWDSIYERARQGEFN